MNIEECLRTLWCGLAEEFHTAFHAKFNLGQNQVHPASLLISEAELLRNIGRIDPAKLSLELMKSIALLTVRSAESRYKKESRSFLNNRLKNAIFDMFPSPKLKDEDLTKAVNKIVNNKYQYANLINNNYLPFVDQIGGHFMASVFNAGMAYYVVLNCPPELESFHSSLESRCDSDSEDTESINPAFVKFHQSIVRSSNDILNNAFPWLPKSVHRRINIQEEAVKYALGQLKKLDGGFLRILTIVDCAKKIGYYALADYCFCLLRWQLVSLKASLIDPIDPRIPLFPNFVVHNNHVIQATMAMVSGVQDDFIRELYTQEKNIFYTTALNAECPVCYQYKSELLKCPTGKHPSYCEDCDKDAYKAATGKEEDPKYLCPQCRHTPPFDAVHYSASCMQLLRYLKYLLSPP